MNKKLFKGGLIGKSKDDNVPVLLSPGVSYVSRTMFEKYGLGYLKKLSGAEKIILIEDEKSS